jgi:hypothetical protein
MRCASCGAETSTGAEYIVRYGSLALSTYRHKTVTKIYKIAGKEDVFLCDSCVDRRVNRLAALYGGGLALVAIVASVPVVLGGKPLGEMTLPIVVLLGLSLYLWVGIRRDWKKGKHRERVGDGMAIRLRKPDLKRQGHKVFWSRED